MMRLVKIMPALLTNWSGKYPKMYEKATVFQVQFLVHFLADLLEQVNMLNLMFQKEHVDITLIGREIDACITLLSTMYLGQKFGDGSKCLKKFLKDAEGGELKYTDESENVHVHKLHFKSLPNSSNLGTLDACIEIGKEFVNALLFSLNERFFDNSIFNAAKLFSPRNYPSDIKDRGQFAKDRLGNLCAKFCVGNSSLVDKEHCEGELIRFVTYLMDSYPTRGLFDTWAQCSGDSEWRRMFPELFKLFQIVMVLPSSSVMCERGFSKQNRIKSHGRASIGLKMLDRLMFMSLSPEKEPHQVDWDAIFDAWKALKHRRTCKLTEATDS
ncbi:hypothetical protein L7F22_017246 [Adiantum nelumboides]|nr:hypothetical protein [Adiantum nelumboides]